PGNRRRQLDQLLFVKVLAELGKQLVRNLDWRLRHCDRVTQDQFLKVGKDWTVLKIREGEDLFLGETFFSAHGRANVHSEGTADERGSLESGQRLDGRRNRMGR